MSGPTSPSQFELGRPSELLKRFGVRPRKGLGQHFLVSRSHLARIVGAAELGPSNVVLEVGPGLGVLTDALARRAGRVVAVEIDPGMRRILGETLRQHKNVEVVAADVLKVDPAALIGAPPAPERIEPGYKVVANLPYNITSAAIRHLLEAPVKPERSVLMLQREVADRILATPGDMSILAVAVQFYATPSLVTTVPAGAFHPRPKVDSAVLSLDTHSALPVDVRDTKLFFRLVRAGFGQKRKQLRNSLAAGLGLDTAAAAALLESAGIDPRRRAQTLSLEEWSRLAAVADSL
ncbi:MAG: 16S rRNA (adenine(1518)-N(6)/adenine(1519)-N(6))-dimethyltransferase RsmA [Anaerolineae bacterium]